MSSVADPLTQGGESIAFLSFQLDRRAGRLTNDGETIPLRPKTWAVLLYLAERPGVFVTRDELLDAVWPNVAVTPNTLNKSIAELRVALGDDAREPRCIETVHGRGFRFIAESPNQPASKAVVNGGSSNTHTFVGREAELRRLGELFAKACVGERQMVFVTGPAGIGKTALVEEFLPSPVLRDARSVWVARGVCVEQHGAREAYMPVLDALAGLAHRPDAERLVGLLRRTAPTWLVQMPWLFGDDADAVRRALRIARPERMLREFAALIESLTSDLTLVLVLEDLHWSDPSTIDLLSFLAQRREPARLLIIGTYRPAEVAVHAHALASVVGTLKMHRQCTELPLHDLSEEEVRQYLDRRFSGATFGPALATKIHKYTDGNPLLMISVVQHELLQGWIVETDPGWGLTIPVEKLQLEIPEDARQVVEMDFESLSPADRALLEAASVVGVEFPVHTVAAALECAVDDAESRCEDLVRRRWFLRAAGNVEWADGSVSECYGFIHELYRNVAYAEIPEGRRRRLHQRIGEALEAVYGDRATEIAATLAAHFDRSGDHTRVVRYLAAAAKLALRRFANREAITNLEDALARVPRLPDEGERRRRELELRLALVPALSDVHGFASEPVRENCDRAYAICVAMDRPEQLFEILYARDLLYWHRADKVMAPQLLAELDDLASRRGSSAHRLIVDTLLVRGAFHSGRFVEACRLAEERLPPPREAAATPLPFVAGVQPLILAHSHVAVALWMLGHTLRARELTQASVAAARETQLPTTLCAALWYACLLEVLSRNPARAGELAEQTLALADEHGLVQWHSGALALHGWVLIQTGMVREGIDVLERDRASIRATRRGLIATHPLAFQADGHRRLGEIDAGLAAVDESLAMAEATLDRSYWPELWRIKGELLLAAGSAPQTDARGDARLRASDRGWREAESCLLRGLEMARESEAKSLELRAATSLARAWHARQRTAEARRLLSEICQWFGADAENVDLAEARTILEQLAPGVGDGLRSPPHTSREN